MNVSPIESSTNEFILFLISVATTAARRISATGGESITVPRRLVAALLVEKLCEKELASLVGGRAFARTAREDIVRINAQVNLVIRRAFGDRDLCRRLRLLSHDGERRRLHVSKGERCRC